jgi:hypothetical protein
MDYVSSADGGAMNKGKFFSLAAGVFSDFSEDLPGT